MKVELISKTQGMGFYKNESIDNIIVGQARISSSRDINELFKEPDKLLRHCILNQHWSIFDLANLGFYVETSRAMGREILRHWTIHPTEFCITGESELTFITPKETVYKVSIKDFYERMKFGSKPIVKKGNELNLESIEHNRLYSTQELVKFGFNKSTLRKRAISGKIPYTRSKNIYNIDCYYFLGSDVKQLYNTDRTIIFDLSNRLSKMKLKTFDLETKTFTTSIVKDVFFNGVKPVYKVILEDNSFIKCTKEHKFFNGEEFLPLENIISLELNNDLTVKNFKYNYVAKNGIPLYQNKDHLLQAKGESLICKLGVSYIAKKFGVSYHTIRKWLRIHKIQFTKKETSLMYGCWNKNKPGYKVKPRSLDSRIKQSLNTPTGKDHHSYRGGSRNLTERDLIQKYINSKRALIYKRNGGIFCSRCKTETCKLELHHIEPVTRNPQRSYDIDNITPLCKSCHKDIHRELAKIPHDKIYDLENYDWSSIRPIECKSYSPIGFNKKKKFQNLNKLNGQTYSLKKIIKVEFVGFEECYDLETINGNHNYVANNIIVHNSQRYSSDIEVELIELREQSKSNRQSSTDIISDSFINNIAQLNVDTTINNYKKLLENNVAKETARFILPETTTTQIYLNGTIRSWITFLNARLHKTAQKEIRLIAEQIRDIFIKECPIISECLYNFENAYNVHILERIVLEKYKVYDKIESKYLG